MRILFINLADPVQLGKKSGEALQKKHKPFFWEKSKITVVQMMDLALQYGNSDNIALDSKELQTIQQWLKNRKKDDKIIIAAHGKIDDTEFCYAETDPDELFKTKKLLSHSQLATFLKMALGIKDQPDFFNITLSICYAARSETYDKDHILDIDEVDILSSFAAKLYKALLADFYVRMKAVTGSVEFDTKTGSLLVESEEAIGVTREYDALNKAIKLFEQTNVNPLVKEFVEQNGEGAWFDYLNNDEYKKDSTPLDKTFIEFNKMQEKLAELRTIKLQGNKKKYGQIIFDYNVKMNQVTVSFKHQGMKKILKLINRDDFIPLKKDDFLKHSDKMEDDIYISSEKISNQHI